jgi:predicted ester cyclase
MTDSTTRLEANKQTVRRLYAAFAASDDTEMDALLSPDFISHGMPPGYTGAEGMKKSCAAFHAGLADCHNEIEDIVAEGDRVVTRYTTRAIHTGELFGVPPSGRSVTLTGMEMFRLANGKVAEFWAEANMSELFDAVPAH